MPLQQTDSEVAASVNIRAGELFAGYTHDIHKRTDRLFAGLMALQWIGGILFALWVSPLAWSGSTSSTHLHVWAAVVLGGLISLFPALLGAAAAGPAVHALHDCDRSDADGRAADPSHRRPHRNAFPRLRLAGVSGVLPGLARAGSRDCRRRAGSHSARILLAAIGLRRHGRQPVALARACGVGHLRRRLSRRRLPAEAWWSCARPPTARRRSSRRSAPASRRRSTPETAKRAATRFSTWRSTA